MEHGGKHDHVFVPRVEAFALVGQQVVGGIEHVRDMRLAVIATMRLPVSAEERIQGGIGVRRSAGAGTRDGGTPTGVQQRVMIGHVQDRIGRSCGTVRARQRCIDDTRLGDPADPSVMRCRWTFVVRS